MNGVFDFDYYGNAIKYTVDFDYDGVTVQVISTQEKVDEETMRDIIFHCSEDYTDKAWNHFLKTGDYL